MWKLVINKDDLFLFRKLHCFMLKRSHLKLNWRAYKRSQTLWTTFKNFKCSAFTYKLKRVYFKEGYSAVSELCNILRLFTDLFICRSRSEKIRWSIRFLQTSSYRPAAIINYLFSYIKGIIVVQDWYIRVEMIFYAKDTQLYIIYIQEEQTIFLSCSWIILWY